MGPMYYIGQALRIGYHDMKPVEFDLPQGNYVPGLNSVLLGVLRAASNLGWEVVGIRDGFDGLLFPDRYSEGGVLPLTLEAVETVSASGTLLLGSSASPDPFHVRTINAENQVEEIDRSEELLKKIGKENVAAVISVAGIKPLSVLVQLHRKGLNIICVPASVENNVAATELSFV